MPAVSLSSADRPEYAAQLPTSTLALSFSRQVARPREWPHHNGLLGVLFFRERRDFLSSGGNHAMRAEQGRDCGAAEIQRIAENAPRWPDRNT